MKISKKRIFLVLFLCFIPSFSLNEIQDLSNNEICEEKRQTDVNDATLESYTTAKDSGSYDHQADIEALNNYSTEAIGKLSQCFHPAHNQASDAIVGNDKEEQKINETGNHASESCFTPKKNQIPQQDDSYYSHSYQAINTDGQTAGYQRLKEDEQLQHIYDACSLSSLKDLMSTVHEVRTEMYSKVYKALIGLASLVYEALKETDSLVNKAPIEMSSLVNKAPIEMSSLVYEILKRIWKLLQERGLMWCLKALMSPVFKVLTKMASMAYEICPRVWELLQDQNSMQLEKFHVVILQFLVSFVATTVLCKMIKSIYKCSNCLLSHLHRTVVK